MENDQLKQSAEDIRYGIGSIEITKEEFDLIKASRPQNIEFRYECDMARMSLIIIGLYNDLIELNTPEKDHHIELKKIYEEYAQRHKNAAQNFQKNYCKEHGIDLERVLEIEKRANS